MKQFLWLPMAAFLFYSCSGPRFPEHPRLVVFLAVDQLPGELMHRIESEFTGGFKWLLDHGVDFRNAHHEHAYTVTGTGYFSLGSGRYPGPAGVLGNSWYIRTLDKTINCVEDSIAKSIGGTGRAASYRQTHATAIGDWIKDNNSKSSVISIAGKDRAAVFMGGKNADQAIYYNWKGAFITSDYYSESLPDWIVAFNENAGFETYRDSIWDHFAAPEFYAKYGTEDNFQGEVDEFDNEIYSPTLPVSFKKLSLDEINDKIGATPWFDKTVLEFAEKLVIQENLGQDDHVDLLNVGISMSDWIGHNHGPHSHEVLDYFLRLDHYLMKFINKIDNHVGLENVIFVLSSDHGAIPLPEYLQSIGIESGRLDYDIFKNRIKRIKKQLGEEIVYNGGGFYFPNHFTNQQKENALQFIKNELIDLNAFGHIFSREEILDMDEKTSFNRRLKNMIHPQLSPDVILVLREYFTNRFPLGSTHGTPYDYDTHVPLIFSHINTRPVRINRSVATVDIAPTIARLAGAEIPKEVDGNVLPEVLK